MSQIATYGQSEVLITRGAPAGQARAIQRRASRGDLMPVAQGIYVASKSEKAIAKIVRRNWVRIAETLVPDAVVSYRSANAGGISNDNMLILSHPTRFNKTFKLPGLTVYVVKGPSALPGDVPLGIGGLHIASWPRRLIENLVRTRGTHSRSAGETEVKKRLGEILAFHGEADLEEICEKARSLAQPLDLIQEFEKLEKLISARLAAHRESPQTDDLPKLLRERHRRDAYEVAIGKRSARSLLMFQKGDLKGIRLTPNPESEYEQDGEGW